MDTGTDNRARILACALDLFAGRGYDAVGVQEIVEAAGVTKPSLYHYFASKRGLLDTLLAEQYADLTEPLARATEYQRDLVTSLRQVMQVYFNFARQHPVFYRMQLGMTFAPPDSEPNLAVRKFQAEQFHLVEVLFACAAEQHGNLTGRQYAYAATLIGLINTHIGLYLNGYSELNDALVYRAVQQFMYGIFS